MQLEFCRHVARQASIDSQLWLHLSSLMKPHISVSLTLELKHGAPALIMFALLHIQIGTLKGDYVK